MGTGDGTTRKIETLGGVMGWIRQWLELGWHFHGTFLTLGIPHHAPTEGHMRYET